MCHSRISSAVYSITVDDGVSAFAFENSGEAAALPSISALISKYEELENLTKAMEDPANCPLEAYPYAVGLLQQMEDIFLDVWDVLETPELPIFANALKEALMDCYIGLSNQLDVQTYFDRLRRETQVFHEAMSLEFK